MSAPPVVTLFTRWPKVFDQLSISAAWILRFKFCAAWAQAQAVAPPEAGHGALPLRAAFEILLTADERTEVSFEDFTDDLSAFLSEQDEQREDDLAGERAASTLVDVLTLNQGLAFLAYAQ